MREFRGPSPRKTIPFNEEDLVAADVVQSPNRFSDYSSIVSGAGRGLSGALEGISRRKSAKEDLKDAKRRRIAELLSNSMKRGSALQRAGSEHQDYLSDYKTQAMQDVARGFAEAFRRG